MTYEEEFYINQHNKNVKTLILEAEGCNDITLSILSLMLIPLFFILTSI